MPNLITHLKKVAEQKPQATYYNVDMIKYQVQNASFLFLKRNLSNIIPLIEDMNCSPHIPLGVFSPGVSRGDPVHSSEHGRELAGGFRQHRPSNRLQIQRGGHGRPGAAAQHPLCGSGERRHSPAAHHDPPRHMVKVTRTSEPLNHTQSTN